MQWYFYVQHIAKQNLVNLLYKHENSQVPKPCQVIILISYGTTDSRTPQFPRRSDTEASLGTLPSQKTSESNHCLNSSKLSLSLWSLSNFAKACSTAFLAISSGLSTDTFFFFSSAMVLSEKVTL